MKDIIEDIFIYIEENIFLDALKSAGIWATSSSTLVESSTRRSALLRGDVVKKNNLQPVSSKGHISFWLEIDFYDMITTLENQLIQTGSTSLVGLRKTFWESHYAKLQDKFGIIWELNAQ